MKNSDKSCEIPGRPTDPVAVLNDFIPLWQSGNGKPFAGKALKLDPELKNIDVSSAVNLTLPKAFFGVTGVECRIILNNLFVLHNKNQAKVNFSCPVGTVTDGVWSYTAEKTGRFPVRVEVTDLAGRQLGMAQSELIISDAAAGNDQNVSMLMIGDSLFAGAQSAGFLLESIREHGNPNFYLFGSHSGAGKPLAPDKAAVEAYGGWRWAHFMEKYESTGLYNSKSKFLQPDENGNLKLDFNAYLQKYHQGKAPDVIVILLGCNDIAHASMDDFDEWMEASRNYRRQLLEHIRSCVPEAVIGLVTLPPGNKRNKSYLDNYQGRVVFQQFAYNQIAYVRQMMLDYQDDPAYSIVPIYQAVDGWADFPEDNAIHPAPQGYRNMAIAIEAWFKSLF